MGNILSRREYLFLPIPVQMQRYVGERNPGPWRALFRVPGAFRRTRKKIFVSGYQPQMTNLSSLLTEILPFKLGGWLFLGALYSAH